MSVFLVVIYDLVLSWRYTSRKWRCKAVGQRCACRPGACFCICHNLSFSCFPYSEMQEPLDRQVVISLHRVISCATYSGRKCWKFDSHLPRGSDISDIPWLL